MKTTEDLKAAFAGESQANRRYLAWAKQAEREGHANIAKLFRAVAAAETIHAHNHFRTLGEVRSTAENLEAAIAGEHYEVKTMYPDFIEDAKAEEQRRAAQTFEWAWEVEKIHEQLYADALAQLQMGDGEDEEEVTYWVCGACGHTHVGDAPPERCPVCNALAKGYMKVE